MTNLDQITHEILATVNGALGCAVVDLHSGMLLSAAHNVHYFTQTFVEAAAAASVDIFRGRNTLAIENLLGSQRGKPLANSIQEIQMTTAGTYHFLTVVPEKPSALLVLITSRSTNLGMGWASLRAALPKIVPLIP